MHEICGMRTGNYDNFNWKQTMLGENISKKYGKMFIIWQRSITLWTIWIECNDKVFNYEQWHAFKVKHQIWEKFIVYAIAAWNRVKEQIKINKLSVVALLQGFDKTWGAKNVLCKRYSMHIDWKLKLK